MHEFLHQHAQHFDGFSEIGAQENLVAGIIGVRRMPALAETFAFAPGGRKRDCKADIVGQGITDIGEIGT
jgi:hypothetical protein